jgi:hypothetical protein
MQSRISPRIVSVIGVCVLLTSAAAPIEVALAFERPGYERPGAAEARAAADAARQRREMEALRQSLAAEAQARAAEERARAMQRRVEDIAKGARPSSR